MLDKLTVIRWLLSHTAVLKQVADIVAKWSADATLSQKLEIVYLVAQAILPIVETFPLFRAQALPATPGDEEEQLVYAQSIGIPPVLLVNVIVPIVVNLLRFLLSEKE